MGGGRGHQEGDGERVWTRRGSGGAQARGRNVKRARSHTEPPWQARGPWMGCSVQNGGPKKRPGMLGGPMSDNVGDEARGTRPGSHGHGRKGLSVRCCRERKARPELPKRQGQREPQVKPTVQGQAGAVVVGGGGGRTGSGRGTGGRARGTGRGNVARGRRRRQGRMKGKAKVCGKRVPLRQSGRRPGRGDLGICPGTSSNRGTGGLAR